MAKSKPKPLCPGCVNYADGASYADGGCYVRMISLNTAGAEPEVCPIFAPVPVTPSSDTDSTSPTK